MIHPLHPIAAPDAPGRCSKRTIIVDDEIRGRFDRIEDRFDAVSGRLDAIVTRLEEQDAGHDRLMAKVDRLATRIDLPAVLSRAGEDAMTSLDALSRRVAKLEAALRDRH